MYRLYKRSRLRNSQEVLSVSFDFYETSCGQECSFQRGFCGGMFGDISVVSLSQQTKHAKSSTKTFGKSWEHSSFQYLGRNYEINRGSFRSAPCLTFNSKTSFWVDKLAQSNLKEVRQGLWKEMFFCFFLSRNNLRRFAWQKKSCLQNVRFSQQQGRCFKHFLSLTRSVFPLQEGRQNNPQKGWKSQKPSRFDSLLTPFWLLFGTQRIGANPEKSD